MYDKILVPLDGSRFSTLALNHAADMAPRYGAALVLVGVVEHVSIIPPVDPIGVTSPVAANTTVEQARVTEANDRERIRRYLSRKVSEIRKQGISAESVIEVGKPADAIMKTARKKKADLIIMATHGRGGLERAFMGSVADQVIRESRQPVLVVRPGSKKK